MVDSSFRITFRNRERKTLQATVISPDIITIKGVNTDEKIFTYGFCCCTHSAAARLIIFTISGAETSPPLHPHH